MVAQTSSDKITWKSFSRIEGVQIRFFDRNFFCDSPTGQVFKGLFVFLTFEVTCVVGPGVELGLAGLAAFLECGRRRPNPE